MIKINIYCSSIFTPPLFIIEVHSIEYKAVNSFLSPPIFFLIMCWNADWRVHCVFNGRCGVIWHHTFFWALVALRWPPEENLDDSRIASCCVELKQLFLSLSLSLRLLSSMHTDKIGKYLLCLYSGPATVPVSNMEGYFSFGRFGLSHWNISIF